MTDPNQQLPVQFAVNLPPDQEVGVFADFAMVWHTPNTFVLDFLAVKQPPQPGNDGTSEEPTHAVLPARVASRVRIPSEQIFMLINALQTQGQMWLQETGRQEPPAGWFAGN